MRSWLIVLGLCCACSQTNECQVTADCNGLWSTAEVCVDRRCARLCMQDTDCAPVDLACGREDVECGEAQLQLSARVEVCEALVCQGGCPTTPCAADQTCVAGRCRYAWHSFEAPPGSPLQNLGFSTLSAARSNTRTRIVGTQPDCGVFGTDACAGPAAEGDAFVVLERVPTVAQAAIEFGVTCTACKRCLECRAPCMPESPAECEADCQACASCPSSPSSGAGLNVCQAQAAARTCTPCRDHQACLSSGGACDESLRACLACRNAVDGMRQFPDEVELWSADLELCEAQGADGCFPTPVSISSIGLDDGEQALVSPPVDLSRATAAEFAISYVPFDVGKSFEKVLLSGQTRTERQRLRVEFCAGTCELERAWKPAPGARELPEEATRNNGLILGQQLRADWRRHRLVYPVPPEFLVPSFRYRLIPELPDGAQIAVDAVELRAP